MKNQATPNGIELPPRLGIGAPHALPADSKHQNDAGHETSTASSSSQKSMGSGEVFEARNYPSQSTNPTSWPSEPLDPPNQKNIDLNGADEENYIALEQERIDSDLAQYGSSDGIRPLTSSDTSSSTSSDTSRKSLQRPSIQEGIKGMGSHLSHPIQVPDAPWLLPWTDHEARVVTDRMKHASAANRAAEVFQSHLQPDPAPELSIHRNQISAGIGLTWITRRRGGHTTVAGHARPNLDIEEQEDRPKRDVKTRAMISVPVVFIVFFTLAFVLYANLRIG